MSLQALNGMQKYHKKGAYDIGAISKSSEAMKNYG